MKIDKHLTEDHQAKLTVEVDNETLEAMKHQAANKLARRLKIPGFRPGKAPYPVVLRTVGEAGIFEEALELLVDKIYPEVIKESEIKPYGPGRLENVSNMDPLTLEFIVPLDAEVKLGEYRALRKAYEPPPVTEAEIEKTLETLRERQAIIEPVERSAQTGDVVTLTLEGDSFHGDEPKKLLEKRSVPLIITSANIDEWPFPGFSENLIGKTAGDEGSIEYEFPEDYQEESLRGRKASFYYTIENVKSRILPELNDEFASTTGEFENLEALRQNISSLLQKQAEEQYNEIFDEELIEAAIEQSEFIYPPQMLDDEIEQVKRDLVNRLDRQGLDMDIYLKSRNMDEKAFRDEITPVAEKRLKRGLLLFEIGKDEGIQVEREELESEAGNTMNYLQQMLPKDEARRLKNTEVQNNLVNNVLVDLLTRKTIERLRNIASGKLEEAAKPDDQELEVSLENAGDLVSTGVIEKPPVLQDTGEIALIEPDSEEKSTSEES